MDHALARNVVIAYFRARGAAVYDPQQRDPTGLDTVMVHYKGRRVQMHLSPLLLNKVCSQTERNLAVLLEDLYRALTDEPPSGSAAK